MIVDEGHNLVDAINAVHSAVISRGQLATAKSALDTYFTRFSSRLAPGTFALHSHCLDNDCVNNCSVTGSTPAAPRMPASIVQACLTALTSTFV